MKDVARRSAWIRSLRRWYRVHGRSFPWREGATPYEVLIAEILLQRSRAGTVEPVFLELMRRWPTASALADASPGEVEAVIRPLGLTSRARRLTELAGTVASWGGLPRDEEGLRALPGVGDYVARATQARMGRRVPLVDAVSARVYRRVFDRPEAEGEALWGLADWSSPVRGRDSWNWAVLDLAASICLPRQPRCGVCPLRQVCATAPRIRSVERSVSGAGLESRTAKARGSR